MILHRDGLLRSNSWRGSNFYLQWNKQWSLKEAYVPELQNLQILFPSVIIKNNNQQSINQEKNYKIWTILSYLILSQSRILKINSIKFQNFNIITIDVIWCMTADKLLFIKNTYFFVLIQILIMKIPISVRKPW